MKPRLGDIVYYYFEHHPDDGGARPWRPGPPELRHRPAIVVDIDNTPDGMGDVVSLTIFWGPGDRPVLWDVLQRGSDGNPSEVTLWPRVKPHHEPKGEVGKVERIPPAPHTWSWR